jgi:hypothetical protein
MHPARRAVFTLLTTLAALLGLEALARAGIRVGVHALLPPEILSWLDTQELVFDPELGWRPAVLLEDIVGAEFPRTAPASLRRVERPEAWVGYALGDSQTRGAGIAEEQAWPLMTERELALRGYDVRLINLGSSGYRSAQVLRLLELVVLPRNPDFIVVDCMVHDSAALRRDAARRWPRMRGVLFESRLYRLLWLGVASARGENLGATSRVHIEPERNVEGAKPGNHGAIAELAARERIPLVFVDYPFLGDPIHSLAPAESLPSGAIVAPATQALIETGLPPRRLFLENNHLSAEGSAVVGRAVADTLEETLWPR